MLRHTRPRVPRHRRSQILTVATLLAGLVAATPATAGPAPVAPASHAPQSVNSHVKPTIVLVHGAWADGSGWSKVVPPAPGPMATRSGCQPTRCAASR